MNIAVIGTGMVGRTLAARLAELGHEVVIGTRDPEATLARTEPDAMGAPGFGTWAVEHSGIRVAALADAARDAELIVNATNGNGSIEALRLAGVENHTGTIILDIANPLDFSAGMPPTLFVKDTYSLGEQIQDAFPTTRVVKSLNTLNAGLMAHPGRLPETSTVFVSGNDAAAKQVVTGLLEEFGHADIIDLGDLSTARGTEMLLPVWLRLWGALGTPEFNFKVVR